MKREYDRAESSVTSVRPSSIVRLGLGFKSQVEVSGLMVRVGGLGSFRV